MNTLNVPEQLNITIRTSIPGHQTIKYNSSMTIKESGNESVKFNPLIKLNESKINTIPENYRIKNFFYQSLFDSMLIYNGGKPAKSLRQATKNGYVDNNIKVTLNTIFKNGSVIYIGGNPYTIGDVQWSSGDWEIENDPNKKKPTSDQKTVVEHQSNKQPGTNQLFSEFKSVPEVVQEATPETLHEPISDAMPENNILAITESGEDICPSKNKVPSICNSKKDYLKQAIIFHPDKNKDCQQEATEKFQLLKNLCLEPSTKKQFRFWKKGGNVKQLDKILDKTSDNKNKLTPLFDEKQNPLKIAYAITIDMELVPGTTMSKEQQKQSKCNSKYNAIRKAYSDLMNVPYVIKPVYTKKSEKKGGKRKTRKRKRCHS